MSNMDLDFEQFQRYMQSENTQQQKHDQKGNDKDKDRGHEKYKDKHYKDNNRERERERERDKDKDKERERDKSAEKKKKKKDEKKDKKKRSRSASRSSKKKKSKKEKEREKDKDKDNQQQVITTQLLMTSDIQKKREIAKQRKIEIMEAEIRELERKIVEVERELEEAHRQDLTVLMYCLPLKAKEKHIYQFFQTFNCGKIRDIRIIRDQKSGRSRGVAYVEFYQEESIPMALALNDRLFIMDGQQVGTIPVKIQLSQAEKNRAARDQKNMQIKQNKLQNIQDLQNMNGPARVQITGMAEQLQRINEEDIREAFAPFGTIETVEIPKDESGRMTGVLYVTYEKAESARNMIEVINNQPFLLNGKPIKVQLVSGANNYMDLQLDDDLVQNPVMRITLMKKLMDDSLIDNINLPPLMTQLGLTVQRILNIIQSPNPTLGCISGWMPLKHNPPACPCTTKVIVLTNMWTDLEISNQAAIVELKEEVENECKKYGEVEMVWVDKKNEGNVIVVFKQWEAAKQVNVLMNNRRFGNKVVQSYFITESQFMSIIK
ncbi:unnamed protein product [Paramecium primaurelia]|uniref:RRM domain-containing protein n=1 Tax=Paramecium primaurelia TaxID=5886 RepID=A0A8S1KXG1_PARPR|nr:unnamed protein product [Paramecium primaurelia]